MIRQYSVETLKKCPFCGSETGICEWINENAIPIGIGDVGCLRHLSHPDDCVSRSFHFSGKAQVSKKLAKSMWNEYCDNTRMGVHKW